jgi:hypothetical protein
MNKLKVSVSGYGGYNSEFFPEGFKQKLVEAVIATKQSDTFKQYDFGSDWMSGRRVEDNERVASVILGEMYNSAIESFTGSRFADRTPEVNLLAQMNCLALCENMSDSDIQEWVMAALSYSGGCDHWYTYEKQWD